MKSVMQHQFSQIPDVQTQRSKFNRSHGYKTTFNSGQLIPVFIDEALPGDTFNLRLSYLARMATPIKPIMDNLFLDCFFFAVPYRLVWDNWQRFNGEQPNPGDSTDFLIPTMTSPASTGYAVGSLSDYFGIPTGIPNLEHSSLFHRAYNLIWNEWFRDQNLQSSIVVDVDNGPDNPSDYVIKKRGKRHDYFTSCLPWPQKGESVALPLGTSAPVVGNDEIISLFLADNHTSAHLRGVSPSAVVGTDSTWPVTELLKWGTYSDRTKTGLITDLTNATAATINSLRQAFQIQKMYERDARGGTRYIEIIRSHFGVVSPDARLQRPEYLGGGSQSIHINPITQNSSSTNDSPQGNLAAMGTVSSTNNGFIKSFTEHCLIIGLVSVRADLNYQQGLDKMFSRQTRFDFFWPSLAHLGEQAVLNKEIFAQGTSVDENVFGYQERYAEYRYKPSKITGQFRSDYAQSLDVWHLAQDFASLPVLGSTFIEENPPVSRVIAVPSEPEFIYDSHIDLICARPMPTYSVPGLIDHF